MLIAQAIFLLEHGVTHRHTKVTDLSNHPTQSSATASMGNKKI